MQPSRARALVWATLATVALALPARAEDPDRKPVDPKECVKTRTEARYSGYGYDHVVHVTNGCDRKMRCAVTTSSNPEATSVVVAPGETESVVAFRGSAAREFTAQADCQPAS